MGIKTKFNPMGGQNEKGKLSDWRYSTADNGQITLYEYLGQYSSTKPVYVPKKGGKTVINNYTSGTTTTASNTPFYNNPNVISVDLQKVPFVNNSMYMAFNNCQNLVSVTKINENVTNMLGTFQYCTNLNQNIQIPNSVTDMYSTFYYCTNLNQNIQIGNSVTNMYYTFAECRNLNQNTQIPNSVTDMSKTFEGCTNLNQNIQIPNSVINMYNTFSECTNLNQNIQIPNSVINMTSAFYGCSNLNQNIQIPNSVTSMASAFYGCSNLNQNIQIPNSVTSMTSTFRACKNLNQNIQIPNSVTAMVFTFSGCYNLQGTINILSTQITNAYNCFYASNLTKNVIFPLRYINNVNTITRNTLVTAATGGYAVGTAVGNLVNNTAQNAVFYAYDHVAWEGYSAWTGNGTHWILSKWAGIGKAGGRTDAVVPQEITSYDTFPTAINRVCFSKNTAITSIDLGTDIPWVGNAVGTGTNGSNRNAVCLNCFNLKSAQGVIRNDVTDISAAFDRCNALTDISVIWPDSATKAYVTYEGINATDVAPFGENMANMQSCFFSAASLINYPVIPPKVTALTTCFANGSSTSAGNVFILSPVLAGNAAVAGAYFRDYNTSSRRNIYAYRCYSNSTNTATWTRFMSNAIYRGTSGNNTSIMYNSTSNFYVYNLSANFSEIWSEVSGTTSTTLLKYNTAQDIPHIAVFAEYPDYNVTSIGNNCFNGAANLISLALYNRPFNTPDLSNAFKNCVNLRLVQGLNLEEATDISNIFNNCRQLQVCRSIPDSIINMANAFYNCTNFNFNVQIGNSVTNMNDTFRRCYNLNQNIQIPNSVTDMDGTFDECTNLNQNIQIPNSVTNMERTFGDCYNLNQNIQIPNSVTGMAWTFGHCTNLNQNIQIGNSVTDMAYTFSDCQNLNQNIQIPNSVTDMPSTFYGCQILNQNIQIPNSVTNMSYTFYLCQNLNQDIQIPSSVTDMEGTFGYCQNLQGTINILSYQITDVSGCFSGTSLPKNAFIPFKYSNGINSATFNSFVSAGYLYSNGVSNNQDGVTIYDLNA